MGRDDRSLLEAALIGYRAEIGRITAAIADIQQRIGNVKRGRPGRAPSASITLKPRKKHRISAEGRARIAEAQRKRWAAAKKT